MFGALRLNRDQVMTLETWLKSLQTSVILLQRHPKPYKLLIFFTISVIFPKMGKHSNFGISSFEVVDAWRILQFDRKTEKILKIEFMWFWGTLSQNYRDFCVNL